MKALKVGVEHVGPAVKDLQTTASLFTNLLGFTKLGERVDYPAILSAMV